MPYYPQSRIKTNLFTNGGEFRYKDTKEIYVGSYWTTYKGEIFSGKSPNDVSSRELEKLKSTSPNLNQSLPPTYQAIIVPTNEIYNAIKKVDVSITKIIPTFYYPLPTEDEYKLGEFSRYFAKQINNSKFIEINKTDYDSLLKRNPSYLFELYQPIILKWQLISDKNQMYIINKNNTLLTETKSNAFGLSNFLKYDYTKFYK